MESSLKGIKVKDIMKLGVVNVKDDKPLGEVATVFADMNLTSVAVVNQNNEAVGVISSLDMVKLFAEKGIIGMKNLIAKDIMTHGIINAEMEDTVEKAANEMVRRKIHRLFVLHPQEKRPMGVVSATDVVKFIQKALKESISATPSV